MPGLTRSSLTAHPRPASLPPSGRLSERLVGTPSRASSSGAPTSSQLGGGPRPLAFRTPRRADDPQPHDATVGATPTTQRRMVYYPEPLGASCDTAVKGVLEQRLARLAAIEYHTPPTASKKQVGREGEDRHDIHGGPSQIAERIQAASTVQAVNAAAAAPTSLPAAEAAVKDPAEPVVGRLPASVRGRVYFQVVDVVRGAASAAGDTEAANGDNPQATQQAQQQESVGIIIVDVASGCAQLFDRLGRQYGNRPDPGYFLKGGAEEAASAAAGATMRVGTKTLLLVTALHEDAFFSGEFFLRREHLQRKIEAKQKAIEQAREQLAKVPKIKFGSGFAMCVLRRRRPVEGESKFVVPLAGRPKTDRQGNILVAKDLTPLHDAEREGALVVFRADYKKDTQGRQIVSVVVDPIIGDKLRPHQRIGVQFLFDCVTGAKMPGYFGAILADEMGLGKTIQTVATVWTCLKQGRHGTPVTRKALVVAPSSLVRNWCNEFDKWLGVGAVKCLAIAESTPKGDRILSRFESEAEVLVISYDQLRKYVERLKTMTCVDLVVCDEGHKLKNAEIKTTKAVDMLPTKRRIVLSGTPIQNDLGEFHAMVGFCNPGILGSADVFQRVFQEPIMRGRDPSCSDADKELGAERAHYLSNLTGKFILRRTQTINEKYLPPKVDVTVFCRLGKEQRYVYERLSSLVSDFGSAPLVLITAMKKLCNHVDLLYDAMTNTADDSPLRLPKSAILPKGYQPGTLSTAYGSKLEFVSLLLDRITTDGSKDKVVIVSNYTQTLNIIARLCQAKRVAFFQLDGNTPIKRRQELVDRFNVPTQIEIVFLLSSKAGGVGLNLIGANRLILFDPDWNPANDAQAMGRVWRDGQKKRVVIYRLLSTGCIEEKIYQRQVSKQGLSANVVDMKDDSKQHFTRDELKQLFVFRPDTVCDTHDLLQCKCLQTRTPETRATASSSGGAPKMSFRQVGLPSAKEPAGGPRMDELKSWQHVARVGQFPLDPVLAAIATKQPELISFAFANERDAQRLREVTRDERPFVADEGAVTMGSQTGAMREDESEELEIVDDDSSSDSSSDSDAADDD